MYTIRRTFILALAVVCVGLGFSLQDSLAQFEPSCRLSSESDPTHRPQVMCEYTPRPTGRIIVQFELRTDLPCTGEQVSIFRRALGTSAWTYVTTVGTPGNVVHRYTDSPPSLSPNQGITWEYFLRGGCPCGGGDYATPEEIVGPITCDPA
jgi:hypothetical protein